MKRVLAAISIALLVGCTGSVTEPDPMAGRYFLTSVDGAAVAPWLSTDSTTIVLLQDDLEVRGGGWWVEHTAYGVAPGFRITSMRADSEQLALSGDAVTFTSSVSGAQSYFGTFASTGSQSGRPAFIVRAGNGFGPLKLFEQVQLSDFD